MATSGEEDERNGRLRSLALRRSVRMLWREARLGGGPYAAHVRIAGRHRKGDIVEVEIRYCTA